MLSISFKKTNYMLITSPEKKTNISITVCSIEQKSQIKYFAQLQHINNKITKNIGILFKLRHYMPMSTLKQLYYTLIYPYLMYGIMSWGTAYQTKLHKIKISQNNCIRGIYFANKRESPTPYFTTQQYIFEYNNIYSSTTIYIPVQQYLFHYNNIYAIKE